MTPTEDEFRTTEVTDSTARDQDERLAQVEKKLDEVHKFERLQITLLGQIVKAMESSRANLWREHDRLEERLDAIEGRRGPTRPGPRLHLVRPE